MEKLISNPFPRLSNVALLEELERLLRQFFASDRTESGKLTDYYAEVLISLVISVMGETFKRLGGDDAAARIIEKFQLILKAEVDAQQSVTLTRAEILRQLIGGGK